MRRPTSKMAERTVYDIVTTTKKKLKIQQYYYIMQNTLTHGPHYQHPKGDARIACAAAFI